MGRWACCWCAVGGGGTGAAGGCCDEADALGSAMTAMIPIALELVALQYCVFVGCTEEFAPGLPSRPASRDEEAEKRTRRDQTNCVSRHVSRCHVSIYRGVVPRHGCPCNWFDGLTAGPGSLAVSTARLVVAAILSRTSFLLRSGYSYRGRGHGESGSRGCGRRGW